MYYKQQWIKETSQVFGSTNKVTLESLAHPTDADATNRVLLLKDKLKMDPQIVLDVDQKYGPLDWRMPETYAIYWAHVGLMRANEHPDRIKKEEVMTLRRSIYQCMQTAFQRGRLIPNYFVGAFEYGPNLEIIPKVSATYEEQMAEQPDMRDGIGTGHRNFLREAVYALYLNGREGEAAKWFKYLGDNYPNKPIITGKPDSLPRNVTLDEFAFAKLEELIGEPGQKDMKIVLEGLITQSYLSLITDQEDRAAGFMNLARKAHVRYQEQVAMRPTIKMPPFAVIQQEVLDRMLHPETGLTDEAAAVLATKLNVPLPPRIQKAATVPDKTEPPKAESSNP